MKTILLFPGIDAIESNHLRKLAAQWPEVQVRINEAQTILNKFKIPINLHDVMISERTESLEWFSAMVLAAMATQVGVFDRYQNQNKNINLLLGMSLGDLARSVCAGVSSFSSTFIGLLQFIHKVTATAGCGSTYQVKLKKAKKDIASALQLTKFEVAISVYQSDLSFLVSGPIENLKQWCTTVNEFEGIKAQELFKLPVPLHHELLKEVATSLKLYIEKHAKFENKKHRIFSSVLSKEIETADELKQGIAKNIYSPVKFAPAIHRLMKNGEPITFVNIGPAATMLAFIKQMDIPRSQYKLDNYFFDESKRINN